MASIYEQALGEQFRTLHPRIQQRFGFSSRDNRASIGEGVMESVWFSKLAFLPLKLGTTRHIMFPQGGRDIPFTIENYAYLDSYGRETVSWNRKFDFGSHIRSFDATMIYSDERRKIVDYLGNKQHLAVDLMISPAPNGGIRIRSGEQRVYERWLGFTFPSMLTGAAEVCEWYDEAEACYRIKIEVVNPIIGPVFRYKGAFQTRFIEVDARRIPPDIKPLREEARE
ncbi:DUF4166 domain-containing protein [Paenibacillus sp. HB172176]|uniref:DUF4166 domain-containing protein n=1 Tax=Paenibacillus sp. HB172176 TaxID=2493690 RepID=UPI00143AC61F|nr:DUF4166 domain-containing protein [Paenibacillus sp. HB172176]